MCGELFQPLLPQHEGHPENSCFCPACGAGKGSNQSAGLRRIYTETLLPVLLPVPLPVLVPIRNLPQSLLVTSKPIEPLDFTYRASQSVPLDHQWSQSPQAHCKTAMQRFDPARRLQTARRACLL